ncbi:hypothetical protein HA402_005458 [Bradysia odoriphaga]|nr:hypothetical protein HA402_005458 [Bradysia odoriphaga]
MDKHVRVLSITQEKFRQGENVVSICESYQIIGSEYKNHLLALVSSGGTQAIFSFAASKWIPESFSDLTIESIYPINDDFRLETSTVGTVSQCQFKLSSTYGHAVYYYYPCSSSPSFKEFAHFERDIALAKSVKLSQPNFQWLEAYQREDLLAIDRSIADGSVTLKKRESKFREELEKREHEYIIFKKFRIYTATWNVNGQLPNDVCLKSWLSVTDEPPDIYAVAFQELDLSPKAITFSESRPDPVWIQKVKDGLHPGADYEELISVRLVGMMLVIAVRQELRKNIIRYSTETVGTGALNFMGNKGGVGVSLQLNEAFICFVNSHLAAHTHEVDRRKEDHDEIIRRMQFKYGIVQRSIDEHNHIFWIGDLNYRIIETQGRNQFDEENYLELLKMDQLYHEMKCKRVFNHYNEGIIRFRPTYKYDPGTDNWDSSEKNRAPAWCDRVLWKGERIEQLTYESVMRLQLSDHKPVYAIFLCGVKTKDEQKYKRVHEDVLKRVDKYENDNQPQITVEQTDIDFDIIRFNETYTRDFTVANNCHLPVHFTFRGKEGKGSKICESWLQVEPTQGELITGDSLSVRLKLFIDQHTAWRMHRKQKESGTKVPLDILVLHVDNGRDIFITMIGEYKPSCFGFSVETLIRLNNPVHELDLKELLKIENSTDTGPSQPNRIEIPREVFLLVDYLFKNGLKTPNLFTVDRRYAKNPNINDIRDWLDVWQATNFVGTPQTAGEALLMLLESSPEPLVSPLEDECLYADTFDKCREIIKILSIPKKNVFLYICFFLQEVLKHSTYNRLDAGKLAMIFGRVFLRGHSTSRNHHRSLPEKEREDRRTAFMYKFLVGDIREFVRNEIPIAMAISQ